MARTIEGLLDKIYFTSGSEAEKGSRFEKLIVAYLQTAGQYADRFSDVRLWQDWEGRHGKADTGIDIVATDKITGEEPGDDGHRRRPAAAGYDLQVNRRSSS